MSAQIKKSDTAKMSHSGKVRKPPAGKVPKTPKSTGWKVLRTLFWFMLVVAALACIALALIWHNRTSLMESQIRKLMAKDGYDVTLDIKTLSKTRAVVTDIEVSKEGKVFFKTEHAVVDYDLNKRMAQRIELVRPYIDVQFDTKGNITSSWMKSESGDGQKLLLPPGGFTIEDATIDWQLMLDKKTVMGSGRAAVSTDVMTDTNWSAHLVGTKAEFNGGGLKGDIFHDLFIETKDGQSFDVFGSVGGQRLDIEILPFDYVRMETLNSQFKLTIARPQTGTKPEMSGWYNAKITGLSLPDYKVDKADVKIADMKISNFSKSAKNQLSAQLSASWMVNAEDVQISNLDMRTNLADKLTAHSAMTNTPIARYFTGTLYNKAERLLGGFGVEGQGIFKSSGTGYIVELGQILRLQAPDQSVLLTSKRGNFMRYHKEGQVMTMQADIDWTGVQALKLTDFTMTAKSFRGTRIDAMQSINANVYSAREWRLHNTDEDVRLAPFDIDFRYVKNKSGVRNVTIKGAIDYDGPVPGGDVLRLKADGDMQLRLRGEDFTLGYTPSKPILIGELSNPSGWTTKSLKFTLAPQDNLLSKTASSGIMRTTLRGVSTQIIGPEGKRHLDANFQQLDAVTDFAKSPQHWQVQVSGTDIKSEDFPAPGTHIVSKTSLLNVYQTSSGDMTFDILSPETRVATDNATIENLHIGLNGSPDDIALEYQAGSVTMIGGAVPVLPMHGTARLKSGELTGHAITNLPRTTDTPIDIHYRSQGGLGSAKILIPKIIFDPRGLQPQQLVPVLRGKLANVSGEASAEFEFKFGDGQAVQSSGWAELKNLDVGTLVGPISGINSRLTFTSIFPLKTSGVQTATLSGFDPGFPLDDGSIRFEIIHGGVKLHQALWPIENIANDNIIGENIENALGKIFLTPTDWLFGDVENRVQVNVENVGLGTMLAGIGKDKLSATGQVFGTLPARIKGVDVLIEDGVLAIKDGGIIRYKSAATDAAAERNENAGHAFKALENFHYKQLEAHIDGPIDGAMALKIVFDGQNPDVLGGQPFQFNTVVKGELANIARNMAGAFSNEENLARILEIQNGEAAEQP